ncbi:hypothetical protein J4462_03380 [Candidatus Pacearchaeota archaeon]|nr:hypothetical protein [Candidatus Pacearchaeota archaeon]
MEVGYFFDSYAIIEIVRNNQNYLAYSEKDVTFTVFNLAEIYYSVLNSFDEKIADEIYEAYKGAVVEISDKILKKAIKFRVENKKRDLSYADCIGYIYSLENGIKFLTGDKEFEGLKGVEFVK